MPAKREGENKPKRGGSDTMREKGLKGVLVGFEPAEHADLKAAAGIKGVGMNEIVKEATMQAVRTILEEFRKK